MSDYTSPGFAVAGTLDQILTQRKAEARQAMLDSLNQQNVQSEISARNENTAGLAQQRDAKAADLKQHTADLRLSKMAPGKVDGGDVDFLKSDFPSFLKQTGGATLPSTSLIGASELPGDGSGAGAASVEDVPSKPDSSIPTTSTFTGDKDYQQKKKWQDALQELSQDPSFQDPSIQKLLQVESLSPDGQKNMGTTLERLLTSRTQQPPPENWTVDASGKAHKLDTPPGAHITQLPNPPRPAAGHPPTLKDWTTTGPDGKPVNHTGWFNPDKPNDPPIEVSVGQLSNLGTEKTEAEPFTYAGDRKLFQSLQAAFKLKNNPEALQQAQIAYRNSIKDPLIKQDVIDIMTDKDPNQATNLYYQPWEKLIAPQRSGKTLIDGLTPAQIEQLRKELTATRGF